MSLRTIIAGIVGRNRNELRKEIDELEVTLNEMHSLKLLIPIEYLQYYLQ